MHRRLPTLLSRSLLLCGPALGLIIAIAPAAGASASSPATPHARAVAAARAALRHLSVGQHATDHAVLGHASVINGLTQVQSTNWSGYADNNSAGNTYSTVTGNWTEPSVTCSGFSESLAAFWVGIDGFTSGSVEQDGTLAECSGGRAFYFTWWEMYPTNSIQVVGQSLRPGDSINASVVRSGSSYTLKVTDSSRSGDSFTTCMPRPSFTSPSATQTLPSLSAPIPWGNTNSPAPKFFIPLPSGESAKIGEAFEPAQPASSQRSNTQRLSRLSTVTAKGCDHGRGVCAQFCTRW